MFRRKFLGAATPDVGVPCGLCGALPCNGWGHIVRDGVPHCPTCHMNAVDMAEVVRATYARQRYTVTVPFTVDVWASDERDAVNVAVDYLATNDVTPDVARVVPCDDDYTIGGV